MQDIYSIKNYKNSNIEQLSIQEKMNLFQKIALSR